MQRIEGRDDAALHLTVFCPSKRRSMAVDECRACAHFRNVDAALLECEPQGPLRAVRAVADAMRVGEDVCVGETMSDQIVCVAGDAPAVELIRAFSRMCAAIIGAVVVDHDRHVIGVVERGDAMRASESLPARRLAQPVAPVHESLTLAAAVARMATERRRVLPVVDDEAYVVGLISDLDALHWVARAPPIPLSRPG
jgi:CBS-domain-containing membrane protein